MDSISVYSIINNKRIDAIWINSDGNIAKDVINTRNRGSKIDKGERKTTEICIKVEKVK